MQKLKAVEGVLDLTACLVKQGQKAKNVFHSLGLYTIQFALSTHCDSMGLSQELP